MNTSPSHHIYKCPVLVWHPESGHARYSYVWFTSVGCVYGSDCTWTGGEGGEVGGGDIGRSDVRAWYSRYNIWDLECTLSYDQDLLGRVIQSRTLRWRVHGTFLLSRTNERCPYRILLKLHTFYFWLVLNYHGMNDRGRHRASTDLTSVNFRDKGIYVVVSMK